MANLKTGVRNVSGSKKRSVFGKFGVLCFLVTPVLRFALFKLLYSHIRIDTDVDWAILFHNVF